MKELPVRKHPRLKGHDYNSYGAYFITACVKDKHEMFSDFVGRDDLGAPYVQLSKYGLIVQKYIDQIESYYPGVFLDNYVIMPNHIHMIIAIRRGEDGAPRSSRPTSATVAKILTALKKLTNKEFGFNIRQKSYHDHIIRDEAEYQKIWHYINQNPARWTKDRYYIK